MLVLGERCHPRHAPMAVITTAPWLRPTATSVHQAEESVAPRTYTPAFL